MDLTRLAKLRGMRGIVLKNHYEPTASLGYLARKAVPGIEIFGGVTLNLPVGGINPHAVDHMARVSGGAGRFVWMGSLDTEAQVRSRNTIGRLYLSPAMASFCLKSRICLRLSPAII